AAPSLESEAIAAFDAQSDRAAAVAASRDVVARSAPRALQAFPELSPRYLIVDPPAQDIEGLKPYLTRERLLPDGRSLYGALRIRREEGAPAIEYWSLNLSHNEPSAIAR